jgi:hypothetical protein
MTLPNFFVLGAAKSGTTSLYLYLMQHPQIYMSPVKEPRYFAFGERTLDWRGPGDDRLMKETVGTLADYEALFDAVTAETAIGEASPSYLSTAGTAARIHQHVPEAKFIAILRDPVERAHSAFLHRVRSGDEPLRDFADAVDAEPQRIADGWSYVWQLVQRGFYHRQLLPYFDLFGRDRIRIYLYEEWRSDNVSVLQDIFRFLDVDDAFVPHIRQWDNSSSGTRSSRLERILRDPGGFRALKRLPVFTKERRRQLVASLVRLNHCPSPAPRAARRRLVPTYREDILELQDLIQRDLSVWLSC